MIYSLRTANGKLIQCNNKTALKGFIIDRYGKYNKDTVNCNVYRCNITLLPFGCDYYINQNESIYLINLYKSFYDPFGHNPNGSYIQLVEWR